MLPGNGSTALMRLLGRAFDLRTIVVLAPAFSEFGRSLAIAGRHFHYYLLKEENNFAPVMHDLELIWRMEPSCVVFSNPLTPSGGLVEQEVLDVLLSRSEARRSWLVVDEAFVDFAPDAAREWAIPKVRGTQKAYRAAQPDQVLLPGRLAPGLYAGPPEHPGRPGALGRTLVGEHPGPAGGHLLRQPGGIRPKDPPSGG